MTTILYSCRSSSVKVFSDSGDMTTVVLGGGSDSGGLCDTVNKFIYHQGHHVITESSKESSRCHMCIMTQEKMTDSHSQPSSLIGTCLTLPNLEFLLVFFKYPKIAKNGNLLFFPVIYERVA